MGLERKSRSFLDPLALARLARLPLLARRPMQGNVSGRHISPHRGASIEFAQYRKYVPGDDLRKLDWRAFGRSDRHYIKESEADTNLRLCLVVDTSGSMAFGSTGITKFEFAKRIAGGLAYLAIQQGDAVGLASIAESVVTEIPPRRNPAHLVPIFDLLERIKPTGGTQLVPLLHELAETIRQRALVVIISDLFTDPVELQGAFEHFRFRKHDLVAFHLLDPLELNFTFHRPMRFLDMEGGSAVFADPSDITDRYHTALSRYLKGLRQVVIDSAVDYHRVMIDSDYEQALLTFLIGRTRAGSVR
jgi:uncharacterized protein (DUF58 family)